ncbi:MAG: FAD-binding oxidoreductase [Gammaproteobacteria bacterium]
MTQADTTTTIIDELTRIAGPEAVLTDEASRQFYSQDIYSRSMPVLAVVRPTDTAQLAQLVACATQAGHAVITRGGGMSYTGGYLAAEPDSILIDIQRLDRIIEINRQDMYVTVECGCTWKQLHEALQGSGLRTPYWGTLSGIKATVGGGLSQNSIFWGSGRYGSAVDSVLSLEVVLADGSVVNTGSDAKRGGSPFFRYYGPDLTGLFCCDTGALGIKTRATLRLIPDYEVRRGASFDFKTHAQLVQAMSEIAREDLAMECFAFDPYLQRQRMIRESVRQDVKALGAVMKASGSVLNALKEGTKLVTAGRGFMDEVDYSLHIMIEERQDSTADAALARVEAICRQHEGRQIEASIPTLLRANPFTPLNNVVGPGGERWVPIHVLVPHSRVTDMIEAVEKVFADNHALVQQHQIGVGFLYATVATGCFIIEPVFFWPDALMEIHRDTIEPAVLKKLKGYEANSAASEAVAGLRQTLIDLFSEAGGIHLQIGKSYRYRDGIEASAWAVVEGIKRLLDPDNRINPGSLGL